MDREIYFFEDLSCYVVRWTGDITLEKLLRHWELLVQDPRFEPGFAALHDARGRALKDFESGIREGAYAYRSDVEPLVGFGRLAILTDDGDTMVHAKRLTALLELESSVVTSSETEAKKWVRLPADLSLPYVA